MMQCIRKLNCINSKIRLVLLSNVLVLLTVFLGLHFLGREEPLELDIINLRSQDCPTSTLRALPSPPSHQTLKQVSPQFTLHYTYVGRSKENTRTNITRKYNDLLCHYRNHSSSSKNTSLSILQSNHSSNDTPLLDSHKQVIDTSSDEDYIPYVIGISPTYYRQTQRLDLTTLCQSLMNVPRFLWIVVEDSKTTTPQVEEILSNCQVESILLHTTSSDATKKAGQRGVDQRNLALQWLRSHCSECEGRRGICEGVVYFMDDDNVYNIRLFEHIRQTCDVSVFPVGLVAGLKFEGPVCKNGKVEKWQVKYSPNRHIPVDMGAFAVNLKTILAYPKAKMGYKPDYVSRSYKGHMEADFLKGVGASRLSVECRGPEKEVLVWHVKTFYDKLVYEKKSPSDPDFKV